MNEAGQKDNRVQGKDEIRYVDNSIQVQRLLIWS